MISFPLVRYVLAAALRDRLLLVLAVVVLLNGAIGVFIGSAAIVEADRFAFVFAASGARLGAMAALVLFVVFYIRRAFEAREIEFLLSRPISRASFVLSHALAFSLLASLMAVLVTAGIWCAAPMAARVALPIWGVSLAAEFIVMANAAFFFAMVLSSAAGSAMATLGLYVLGRLMGGILGVINHNNFISGFQVLAMPAKIISVLIPRLDLLAQSSWLIYGRDQSVGWGIVLAQGGIFTGLLVVAALVDLLRRQF